MVLPGQADPHAVQAVTQANLPNLPINDPSQLPDPAKLQTSTGSVHSAHGSCYPSSVGTAGGYQASCYSAGDAACCYELADGWVTHFGIDPYQGNGYTRYVYIVDEMEGTRASEWLAWYANQLNSSWFYPGNPTGKRPYFVYFSGSWLRQQGPAYSGYHDCLGGLVQFMEFCLGGHNAPYSYSTWTTTAGLNGAYLGKVGSGDATINAWDAPAGGAGDPYVEYSVIHEFGHLFGNAHDQDCQSVMTYCGTVGNQYLYPTTANWAALGSIYDQPPNGPYAD